MDSNDEGTMVSTVEEQSRGFSRHHTRELCILSSAIELTMLIILDRLLTVRSLSKARQAFKGGNGSHMHGKMILNVAE